MHLSGFDVLLMVAVPLAVCAVATVTWWVGMSRYRRAAAVRRRGLVTMPAALPTVVEPAQPAPAPLTAGGSSESALALTP